MKKIKGCIKTFAAYAVVLTMLLSLMAFPNTIHGSDNEKRMVSIKTFNGKYLCAENGGGSTLTANRDRVEEWETFQMIDLGKGYIALMGCNGEYVSVSSGGKDVNVDGDEIKQWNTFQLVKLDKNKIALKTHNKKYLSAEDGGGGKVIADRKKVGNWETFELIEISKVTSDKCILTATSDDKSISFTWTKPSSTKDIIGYNLYRGTEAGRQSRTPITDFPIEENFYTDKNVENNITYYYILKVVYRDKTLGTESHEVAVRSNFNNKTIVLEVGSRYMLVDGQRKEIDQGKGTAMIMKNGRTFLPIKAVIESLGGEVVWDSLDKKVSIYLKNNKIHLWIGDKIASVNGSNKETDVAPYISESGRTMLPLRFIVENLGCEAEWDGIAEKVTIKVK